jgi:hypothetical protein
MKNLEKFTKEMIDGFIAGTQASYERGDTIDPRKELTFIVTDSGNKFHIKAIWIKEITYFPTNDPTIDIDTKYFFTDYYFSVNKTDTLRKLSHEIHETLDFINE